MKRMMMRWDYLQLAACGLSNILAGCARGLPVLRDYCRRHYA